MTYKLFTSFSKAMVVTLSATTIALASGGVAVAYDIFHNEKDTSSEQFDFPANDISESEIVLDGEKDSAYGAPVIDFGLKTSGAYDINVYSYHGDEALYLFFDVYDKYVTQRAIGDNNAQDEDGVEISIDTKLNGGTTPQTDDLRIYLGVTGFSRVLRGNGTGWDSTAIGFGGQLKTKLKEGTTPNDNTNIDPGYSLEYRIPYISIFGEANKDTPLAFAFVQSDVTEVTGSRTRTGMSGHPTFKIPTADTPGSFPVLTSEEKFYTRTDYNNLNENMPMVVGKVLNKNNIPLSNVNVSGYYSKNPYRIYSKTTNNDGYFSFEDIKTNDDFIVKAEKAGHLPCILTYSSQNLINANGAEYYQEFTLLPNGSSTRVVTGKINALDGESLLGFTVALKGHESIKTTTNSNGEFSIEVYSDVNNALIISKNGYETTTKLVDTSTSSVPAFEMFHNVTNLIMPLNKNLFYNYASAGIARGNNALFIKASTPYLISGNERLSLYLNTSNKSGFNYLFNNDDYRIDLMESGASIYRYDDNLKKFVYLQEASSLISYEVVLDVLYESVVSVPYAVFNFDKTNVFGAACEFFNSEEIQNSYTKDDIAKDGIIDASSTATYLRFSPDGKVFFSNNNTNTNFLYYYHGIDGATSEDIPNNADRIYAEYERDVNGLVMRITVSNGFGTHFNTQYGLAGPEAINLLLNIDGVNSTGWALYTKNKVCYDINFRIYSDDTICYVNSTDLSIQLKDQMWWSDAKHNNGVAKNFTLNSKLLNNDKYEIDSSNGSKTYVIRLSYADLLSYGNAPSGVTLNQESPISTCLFEVSETSKTTIRFYTSSGDAWLFKNRQLSKTIGAFSSQANYVDLPVNK